MGKCHWRGFKGVGLPCTSGCATGETKVSENTNHHEKKSDQTCNGGLQSYCCAGFKPAPSKAQLKKDAADAAKAAAEAAAENAALDIAAKAFCRVAVPALLLPLELAEDLIPIFGEIADLVEIAATPAIIEGCVKGVEKGGKAEFKVFGKKHTLDINKPTNTPKDPRPPAKTHDPPKTSGKPTNKPSKTDQASKTKSHSSTSSSSPTASQEPRKCYSNKCGAKACLAKRSLPSIELSERTFIANQEDGDVEQQENKSLPPYSELSKRAFFSIAKNGDVERLAKKKTQNVDLSDFADRNSEWIPFDGKNPKSITVVGLEGCTVILAMSDKGMIASHLFESGQPGKGGKAILTDTLNPDHAKATIEAVGARLILHAANLAGGQLLVMLPVNPISPGEWKYDSESSTKYTAAGTPRKAEPRLVWSRTTVTDILAMAKTATGIADAKEVRYIPPKTQEESDSWVNTAHGTIAVQYDPKNSDGGQGVKQARQIWCENHAQYSEPIVW